MPKRLELEGNNIQRREKVERVMEGWIETAAELGRPIPKPKGRLHYKPVS